MLSYFDHIIEMDFLKYSDRKEPLLKETLDIIVDAYNATPPDFQNPSNAVIQAVMKAVENQMDRDQKLLDESDFFHYSDGTDMTEEESPTPSSNLKTESNEK